jgi:hypothetical protein
MTSYNNNIKDLTTIATKDFGNPVQVDTEKLFLYRALSNDSTSSFASPLKRRNSEREKKMRAKTAHIGRKASYASQGKKFEDRNM